MLEGNPYPTPGGGENAIKDAAKRAAATDSSLDVNKRIQYAGHTDSIGTDAQPYTKGYRVKLDTLIGAASRSPLQVDLAVGPGPTGDIVTTAPATALTLPRLVSNPYRLYPVVDQIADKVCATITDHHDKASSREKDLVDLVVFSTTQDIDGTALRVAITTQARRRKMDTFGRFTVPSTWGPGYTKLSKPASPCATSTCRAHSPLTVQDGAGCDAHPRYLG